MYPKRPVDLSDLQLPVVGVFARRIRDEIHDAFGGDAVTKLTIDFLTAPSFQKGKGWTTPTLRQ